MDLDHRAARRGSRHVLARLAAAGLALALLAATGTALATTSRTTASGREPLAGRIIGIDPGHNGLNYTDPAFLNHKIWNGREWEDCDTTGTETAGGGPEAQVHRTVPSHLRPAPIRARARGVSAPARNPGTRPSVHPRPRAADRP